MDEVGEGPFYIYDIAEAERQLSAYPQLLILSKISLGRELLFDKNIREWYEKDFHPDAKPLRLSGVFFKKFPAR